MAFKVTLAYERGGLTECVQLSQELAYAFLPEYPHIILSIEC
jgi:hypothetical protein